MPCGSHLWCLCSAVRVPALQFEQHRPEQFVIRRAGDEGSLGDHADKHRRGAALGCPAEPITKFSAAVRGFEHREYTPTIWLGVVGSRRELAAAPRLPAGSYSHEGLDSTSLSRSHYLRVAFSVPFKQFPSERLIREVYYKWGITPFNQALHEVVKPA